MILAEYIHHKLTDLHLTNDVSITPRGILIEITRPFYHRIEIVADEIPYIWEIQLESGGVVITITTPNVRYILNKQTEFRIYQRTHRTDEGVTMHVTGIDDIEVVMNYEGRFNVSTEHHGEVVMYRKPFIDYWKCILNGLDSYT